MGELMCLAGSWSSIATQPQKLPSGRYLFSLSERIYFTHRFSKRGPVSGTGLPTRRRLREQAQLIRWGQWVKGVVMEVEGEWGGEGEDSEKVPLLGVRVKYTKGCHWWISVSLSQSEGSEGRRCGRDKLYHTSAPDCLNRVLRICGDEETLEKISRIAGTGMESWLKIDY